jgi:type VI secretion system secreted protein VgrG
MSYTQENRLIALTTPLGEDKLLLAGFSGHEAISRLFSFQCDLLSEDSSIAFTDIIGKNVTISVQQSDNTLRYFNGIVSRFTKSGGDTKFTHYQMEIVPWTWLLTRYANCKIFHNKSVTEIIKDIFSEFGLNDFKLSTTGTYEPLEYCVQYRETAFNFISRLMEQNGIFYFFQHEETKHTMVLADASSAHQSLPGFESAGYNLAGGGVDDDDVVNSWSVRQELRSGKYTLTDYNFETPSASLLSTESTIYSVANNTTFEVFDYPGLYTTRGDGTTAAKLRMGEIEAGHEVASGSGVCRAFTTGYKFELTDHPQDDFNDTYVLTEIQHSASVAGNFSSGGTDSAAHYSNNFNCIPIDVEYRPERLTPKPFVQGPQSAVVVGSQNGDPAGNDIWVDKYGRVVVLFPWDRDKSCSCWVRVSQEWAGQGYGSMAIPRVGQEVLVSFLEGDPDRPIITGRVYNATETVPYTLPDYQTRSTFMTRSSKGGDTSTYNELRFEDKKGAEQVFLRAQYDMDVQTLHDTRENVGNNMSLTVGNDQMEEVDGNRSEKIAKINNVQVGADRNEQVGGNEMIKIGGDRHEQVAGQEYTKITGDTHNEFDGNLNQKVSQTHSLQVGMDLQEKSGQNYAHEAGMAIHLKAGTTVVIEAGVQLSLKVGGNFIDISPAGVSIVGTMVMINSGGAAGSGAGSSPTSPTAPKDPGSPTAPDKADDGKTGTKLGGGAASTTTAENGPPAGGGAPAGTSGPASSSPPPGGGAPAGTAGPSSAPPPGGGAPPGTAGPGGPPPGGGGGGAVAGAAGAAANQVQQLTKQAASGAQQAANDAQQAVQQAQQAAQQGEQLAQQAVRQVTDEARKAFNDANHAVQQAQQAVNQASAQGQAAAQQALAQAQQAAQTAAQQAAQAVQQAKKEADQVQQQAQQTVAQAQQQAQQAQQQAQQAATGAQQQAQQAEQQAKQAATQAQAAAKQAEQQAQQAGKQVSQAASQATQQAQQAASAAQKSASQAINQAQRGF